VTADEIKRRSVEGNRYNGENGTAQAQNQPQGSAGKKA
jgi:protocatechuate 4,5-dioxygenase alpha chain